MIDILLIEDDPDIADNLQEYLTNASEGKWRIHISDNGDDGLELATQTIYSLILLDIGLPGRDGFGICRSLRRRGIQTPVIFVTARYTEEDILKGYECGGDDYIVKPFSMAQLSAKIKAFLKRYCETDNSSVSYLNLTADAKERKLYAGGAEISLLPREFDILLYLMQHPERLISREELLARVWGADSEAIPRNLDNPIKNIRKAIASSEAIIVTQRGYGYRLEAGNV